MITNRLFHLLIVVGLLVVTACAPQVPVTPEATSAPVATVAQDEPITLRLAVADGQGHSNSQLYVQEFVEQVKILSNGNITIEPVWDAGSDTPAGFETGVIQLVRKGELELGLAGSRAWDTDGVTSFQALQAPFLITNDAVALAVARSDIATQMLNDLSSAGVVGLALWPEDLRHPFSIISEKPLLSAEDLAGLNFRTPTSEASKMLFASLGATPMMGDSGDEAGETGLRQLTSLMGAPTATGNITFFAKYQTLFANGPAFAKLSEAQHSVLREAAAATQKKAIAEHPSDAESGTAWCAGGGSIVLASDAQVAAFEKVTQPVFDSIKQNPLNAKLIGEISELKAKTEPSAGAGACSSAVAQQNPTPGTDSQIWSGDMLPNGTWQIALTNDDVIKMGVLKAKAPDWSGVYTFTFQDGVFHWNWEGTDGYAKGQTASADGSYEVVEDFVRLTSGDVVDDFQWRLDEEGLHFHLLATQNDPFIEIRAILEAKPYQKIADQ